MLNFRYPDKPQPSTLDFVRTLNTTDWVAQSKLDGWRVLCSSQWHEKDNVEIYTRHNVPLAKALKQKVPQNILNMFKNMQFEKQTIYDGEFIGRRGAKEHSIGLFDILMLDGKWITNLPFVERFGKLTEIYNSRILGCECIFLTDTVEKDFVEYYEKMHSLASTKLVEGIVIKNKNSKLIASRKKCEDNPGWFKIKW